MSFLSVAGNELSLNLNLLLPLLCLSSQFVCLVFQQLILLLIFCLLIFQQLEGDETFQEFLVVHQKRSQVATWANDTLAEKPKKEKSKAAADYLNFDSDESEDLSEEERDGNEPSEEEEETKGTKRSHLCSSFSLNVSVLPTNRDSVIRR